MELIKTIDTAFPERVLRQGPKDIAEAVRWQIISACWDEYAACRISATFGQDQTAAYAETFVTALTTTREHANERIREYRLHGDRGRVLVEVSREYGNLLKFASYLLGHLHGIEADLDSAPDAKAALDAHWFAPFFSRLSDALLAIWAKFGRWSSPDEFESIGEIANDLIVDGGVGVVPMPGGQVYVVVPFTPETMPISSD